MKKIGVLCSGRGSNLEALIKNKEAGVLKADIALVLSDNADARALSVAREHGIRAVHKDPGPKKTWIIPEIEHQWVQILKDFSVDLVCLAGFMRIIKKPLLAAFPGRILNIHPALLPAFPGLEGQKQALEYGVKVSGCTVHFVDEHLDHGPIVVQRTVPVLPDDDEHSLSARILEQEHIAYTEAINIVLAGNWEIVGRRVLTKTPQAARVS